MSHIEQRAALLPAPTLSLGAKATLGDWATLIRPRVALMVAVVAAAGALLAPSRPLGLFAALARSLEAAFWITLVTGCASVLNQVLERDVDGRMRRTQDRPLVTGRIAPRDALLFGAALGVVGSAGLALSFNLLAAFFAVATLTLYVGVYTPMKRVSSINTVVGAVAGAAPPLLGYVALEGSTGPWAWMLFAILFAWQFPHFMAIAWLYREDYAAAGMRMLPALPNSEGVAGRQAVLYASSLLAVALLPALTGLAGGLYAVGAFVLSAAYLAASVAFCLREDRPRARALLLVSLVHLPLLLALVLADSGLTFVA